MQRILYRTPTPEALAELFERHGADDACDLPLGEANESVLVGAWVLAVFETTPTSELPPISVGPNSRPPASSRATCAPARVVERPGGGFALRFSEPDWQRIAAYAHVRRESQAPNRASERVRSARPVQLPSVFPAAPLPQVESMCIMHWFSDASLGAQLAAALGAPCVSAGSRAEVEAMAESQARSGQRLDAIVVEQPADEQLVDLVTQLRARHVGTVIVGLVSGARAQLMRALYEAGADEILQAQTSSAEVAVTLLALVRRRSAKNPGALGAA